MLRKITALMLSVTTALFVYSVTSAETSVYADNTEDVQITTDLDKGTSKVSIYIRTLPEKTVYDIGEELDLTGGVYDVYETVTFPDGNKMYADIFLQEMSDGSKKMNGFYPINLTIDTSEFDSTNAGIYTIYITASDEQSSYTENFTVTVQDADILKPEQESDILGDANGDFKVSISDSVKILQYIANAEKYPLTEQQKINADCYNTGDGITGMDAQAIQELDAGGYSAFIERDGVIPDDYVLSVNISDMPEKTLYNIGEELDLTGGTYTVSQIFRENGGEVLPISTQFEEKMTDGEKHISYQGHDVDVTIDTSGFDNTKEGSYLIGVTAKEGIFTATQFFEVKVKTDIIHLFIKNLPDKLEYNIGEELDLTGGVYGIFTSFTDFDGMDVYNENPCFSEMADGDKIIELTDNIEVIFDTSKFDNTKAGTYPISILAVSQNGETVCESFDVEVK